MRRSLFLTCAAAVLAIISPAANAPAAAKTGHAAPAKVRDWSVVVSPSAAGGFVMGNPDAKVNLIEYGSMTCPHCARFDASGVPNLIDKYVKTGEVSWEFRNYVRDPFDLTATLIARCNGTKGFFPLMRAIYKDQPTWVAKIQSVPQAQLEALQNLPPKQEFVQAANFAGLTEWAAARGIPPAKGAQCLGNESTINQLVQMTSDATTTAEFAERPTPSVPFAE